MEHGNWKSMYEAACAGDLELVRYYVESGVDVNYVHPEFMSTALVSCILADQAEVAIYLLDNSADPLLRSPWEEMNPVEAAAQRDLPDVSARLAPAQGLAG
ncbi:MAG: ankyrin repeat domain-containing protein [Candidatus Nanopelagicales bacterium]